jgi:RNA polymerase sigma factor (sigma-70 family)
MPAGEGSITHCLVQLEAGDEAAVRAVLDQYRHRLEVYARRLLRGFGASRAVVDEQDLAHEAILIVVVGIRRKKYKDLHDRQALNRLLLTVTRRLVIKLKRYQTTRRRTWHRRHETTFAELDSPLGRVPGPVVPGGPAARERWDGSGSGAGLRWYEVAEEVISQVPDRGRNPEELFAVSEEIAAVFDVLEDRKDRDILRLKLEGYTHAEIAERLDCSKRTVTLRFQRICLTIRKLADARGRSQG